jgi:hypothetical protein
MSKKLMAQSSEFFAFILEMRAFILDSIPLSDKKCQIGK